MEDRVQEILDNLILEVGAQVTRDYASKHGLWEGMSISNVKSRDIAKEKILETFERYDEDKEELEKIISRNGVLVQDGWGEDPADLIDELMKWKSESQQL